MDYTTGSVLMLPTPSKHSALQVTTKVNVQHRSDSTKTTVTTTATWTTTLPTNAEVQLQDGPTPSSDLVPCGLLSAHARLSQEAVEQHSQPINQTLGSYDGHGLNDSPPRHSRSNSSSVVPSEGESMTESANHCD